MTPAPSWLAPVSPTCWTTPVVRRGRRYRSHILERPVPEPVEVGDLFDRAARRGSVAAERPPHRDDRDRLDPEGEVKDPPGPELVPQRKRRQPRPQPPRAAGGGPIPDRRASRAGR